MFLSKDYQNLVVVDRKNAAIRLSDLGRVVDGNEDVRNLGLVNGEAGVVTGLAYTPYGGEVLFIEAIRYPGKGNVILTGQIGEVMKESVQAALSLVRTRANTENDFVSA